MRDTKFAKMVSDAVEPLSPLRPRRFRELLVLSASLVVGDHEAEVVLVRRPALLKRFVVGGDEFRRTGLATEPRAAAPRIPIGAALQESQCTRLINAHV